MLIKLMGPNITTFIIGMRFRSFCELLLKMSVVRNSLATSTQVQHSLIFACVVFQELQCSEKIQHSFSSKGVMTSIKKRSKMRPPGQHKATLTMLDKKVLTDCARCVWPLFRLLGLLAFFARPLFSLLHLR